MASLSLCIQAILDCSQSFIALLLILVLHTGICVLLGRDTIFLAVKQLAGIIVSYLFYGKYFTLHLQ